MNQAAKDYFTFGEGKDILETSEVFLQVIKNRIEDGYRGLPKKTFKANIDGYEYLVQIEEGTGRFKLGVIKEKEFTMTIIYNMKEKMMSYALNQVWIKGITKSFFPISIAKDENKMYFKGINDQVIETSESYLGSLCEIIDENEIKAKLSSKEKTSKKNKKNESSFEELKRLLQQKLEE